MDEEQERNHETAEMDGSKIVGGRYSRLAYTWIAVHFMYIMVSTGVAVRDHGADTAENESLRVQYAVTLAILIVCFPVCLLQVFSVVHVRYSNAADLQNLDAC